MPPVPSSSVPLNGRHVGHFIQDPTASARERVHTTCNRGAHSIKRERKREAKPKSSDG